MVSKITFHARNIGKEIEIDAEDEEEASILEIAIKSGVYIQNFCNGKGVCGKCRVIVDKKDQEGLRIKNVEIMNKSLTQKEREKGYVLACLAYPKKNTLIRVDVPEESMEDEHQVLIEKDKIKGGGLQGEAGIAIDVGTTTVAAYLVDLSNGNIIDSESDYNGQVIYGGDVMTRINHVLGKERGADDLQRAIDHTLNGIIKKLVRRGSVKKISEIVISSNTTMNYLLLKKNPKAILDNVQVEDFKSASTLNAADIGLGFNARTYLLPNIANYVGGDIVAGILFTGMFESEKPCIMIDVGTNGEIALGNRDWMVCCSTSAGPAFEGGETTCGMRATAGAIDWIRIDNSGRSAEYRVIGGGRPKGICGSGLITLLAELVRNRVIDHCGRFDRYLDNPRLRKSKNTAYSIDDGSSDIFEYVIVPGDETSIKKDIVITERDIQNILYSKAAIYAGISTLMTVGTEFDEIDKLYIAGGFGNYINLEAAITFGLLPDIDREKYEFVGNSSLKGAYNILVNNNLKDAAKKIAKETTYFDLSANNQFMQEYSDAMYIPHKNLDRFPSHQR